ncbi:MAG: YicC family protein [Clostridiaceae bacterium]|nr:YicC family protein [Clostridiaceae bacterium]
MIKSMTGYGRAQRTIDNYDITAEIKTVNHRYLDLNYKSQRFYLFLEEAIKKHLTSFISRGKVDVFISIHKQVDTNKNIVINTALAKSYIDALDGLSMEFGIENDIKLSSLIHFNDIFDIVQQPEDQEQLTKVVLSVVDEALTDLMRMRRREGEILGADMLLRNNSVRSELEKIEAIEPETVEQYRQKLQQRITELVGNNGIDENRILTETAIFADKISVTEEITRMHSHLNEFEKIMGLGMPIGRKLDFLLQEMNREINTIGSKSNNISISKIVVNIKAELEKIREQLQNIE